MTLDDVVALTCMHIFREVKVLKLLEDSDWVPLGETYKKKLEALNQALSKSKLSKKKKKEKCFVGKAF